VDGAPDFAVRVEAPAIVHAGAPLTATLVVTNTGELNLRELAAATTLPDCNWGAPRQDNWATDVIEIGEAWRVTCVTRMESGGVYTATDKLGQHTTRTASHALTIIHPALAVSVAPDAALVAAGAPITFTYAVTNTGDTLLAAVNIRSALTGDHPLESAELAPGAAATLVAPYTVPLDALTAIPRHVSARAGNPWPARRSPPHTRQRSRSYRRRCTSRWRHRRWVVVGDTARYHARIENTGAVTLHDLALHAAPSGDVLATADVLAPGAQISVTGALVGR
jgi:hypothetical protein